MCARRHQQVTSEMSDDSSELTSENGLSDRHVSPAPDPAAPASDRLLPPLRALQIRPSLKASLRPDRSLAEHDQYAPESSLSPLSSHLSSPPMRSPPPTARNTRGLTPEWLVDDEDELSSVPESIECSFNARRDRLVLSTDASVPDEQGGLFTAATSSSDQIHDDMPPHIDPVHDSLATQPLNPPPEPALDQDTTAVPGTHFDLLKQPLDATQFPLRTLSEIELPYELPDLAPGCQFPEGQLIAAQTREVYRLAPSHILHHVRASRTVHSILQALIRVVEPLITPTTAADMMEADQVYRTSVQLPPCPEDPARKASRVSKAEQVRIARYTTTSRSRIDAVMQPNRHSGSAKHVNWLNQLPDPGAVWQPPESQDFCQSPPSPLKLSYIVPPEYPMECGWHQQSDDLLDSSSIPNWYIDYEQFLSAAPLTTLAKARELSAVTAAFVQERRALLAWIDRVAEHTGSSSQEQKASLFVEQCAARMHGLAHERTELISTLSSELGGWCEALSAQLMLASSAFRDRHWDLSVFEESLPLAPQRGADRHVSSDTMRLCEALNNLVRSAQRYLSERECSFPLQLGAVCPDPLFRVRHELRWVDTVAQILQLSSPDDVWADPDGEEELDGADVRVLLEARASLAAQVTLPTVDNAEPLTNGTPAYYQLVEEQYDHSKEQLPSTQAPTAPSICDEPVDGSKRNALCPICEYPISIMAFQRHQNLHKKLSGQGRFCCRHCRFRGDTTRQLQNHTRLHSGPAPNTLSAGRNVVREPEAQAQRQEEEVPRIAGQARPNEELEPRHTPTQSPEVLPDVQLASEADAEPFESDSELVKSGAGVTLKVPANEEAKSSANKAVDVAREASRTSGHLRPIERAVDKSEPPNSATVPQGDTLGPQLFPLCAREFLSPRKHMPVHREDEYKYSCPQCSYTCATFRQLAAHWRVRRDHDGPRLLVHPKGKERSRGTDHGPRSANSVASPGDPSNHPASFGQLDEPLIPAVPQGLEENEEVGHVLPSLFSFEEPSRAQVDAVEEPQLVTSGHSDPSGAPNTLQALPSTNPAVLQTVGPDDPVSMAVMSSTEQDVDGSMQVCQVTAKIVQRSTEGASRRSVASPQALHNERATTTSVLKTGTLVAQPLDPHAVTVDDSADHDGESNVEQVGDARPASPEMVAQPIHETGDIGNSDVRHLPNAPPPRDSTVKRLVSVQERPVRMALRTRGHPSHPSPPPVVDPTATTAPPNAETAMDLTTPPRRAQPRRTYRNRNKLSFLTSPASAGSRLDQKRKRQHAPDDVQHTKERRLQEAAEPRRESLRGPLGAGEDLAEKEEEESFCYCGGFSEGKMICCDNESCPRLWFHFSCVGLSKSPSAHQKWFCQFCVPPDWKSSIGNGVPTDARFKPPSYPPQPTGVVL